MAIYQMVLDWAVLSISLFNTISLIWLGVMILLAGNRKVAGTWFTGGGLLFGALFFISHTAIVGQDLARVSLGMNIWWAASWVPATLAPFSWYASMLWHTGFTLDQPHPHRVWFWFLLFLVVGIVFLLIFANPLPSYGHVVAIMPMVKTPSIAGIPLLVVAYLLYSMLCYLLPVDLLRRPEEKISRRRARPWLVGTSLLLFFAGCVMVWTALWALGAGPSATLLNTETAVEVKRLDLVVETLIAMAITLLGRAIVAYEVFTGRSLPRHGFFRHWRSTVILATAYSTMVAGLLVIQLRPLYSLMLATMLMTFSYALYSWRSFADREQYITRLRPFVASQNLYDQLVQLTPVNHNLPQKLFETLCRDVLQVKAAALLPSGALTTLIGPPLVYPDPNLPFEIPSFNKLAGYFESPELRCVSISDRAATWAVSLWNERGLGGVLLLQEKSDGQPYTEEEMEIAQAGGERVLDMLAGVEMARLSMSLLRQRIGQARVLEGQGRRILHDDVLPQLHTAILQLNRLEKKPEVEQTVVTLSKAHRKISDLMRDTPSSVPQRLAKEGLVQAIRSLIEGDMRGEFDSVIWNVDPRAVAFVEKQPSFVNEVVYFTVRELLRNASVHGRRKVVEGDFSLDIKISFICNQDLVVSVTDNGIGYLAGERKSGSGARSGLRFHSAMLAAVGGRLEMLTPVSGGTSGIITVPEHNAIQID